MPNRKVTSGTTNVGKAPKPPSGGGGNQSSGIVDPSVRVSQPLPDPSVRIQGPKGR